MAVYVLRHERERKFVEHVWLERIYNIATSHKNIYYIIVLNERSTTDNREADLANLLDCLE